MDYCSDTYNKFMQGADMFEDEDEDYLNKLSKSQPMWWRHMYFEYGKNDLHWVEPCVSMGLVTFICVSSSQRGCIMWMRRCYTLSKRNMGCSLSTWRGLREKAKLWVFMHFRNDIKIQNLNFCTYFLSFNNSLHKTLIIYVHWYLSDNYEA